MTKRLCMNHPCIQFFYIHVTQRLHPPVCIVWWDAALKSNLFFFPLRKITIVHWNRMGFHPHWTSLVFQLGFCYSMKLSLFDEFRHFCMIGALNIIIQLENTMCPAAINNDIMLKYSSRLRNANCMQISNMIHVLIWHAEWWLDEWE